MFLRSIIIGLFFNYAAPFQPIGIVGIGRKNTIPPHPNWYELNINKILQKVNNFDKILQKNQPIISDNLSGCLVVILSGPKDKIIYILYSLSTVHIDTNNPFSWKTLTNSFDADL